MAFNWIGGELLTGVKVRAGRLSTGYKENKKKKTYFLKRALSLPALNSSKAEGAAGTGEESHECWSKGTSGE